MTGPGVGRLGLLPVYLVLDVSADDSGGVPPVASLLAQLWDRWSCHPTLSDRLRLAVLDLAGTSTTVLTLGDPLELPAPPALETRPGRSLAAALDAVTSTGAADVAGLLEAGFLVQPPLVVVVLTGPPEDAEWRPALRRLAQSPMQPTVLPCGLGDVEPELLAELIHPGSGPAASCGFHARSDAAALGEVLSAVVARTGYRVEGERSEVVFPAPFEVPSQVAVLAAAVAQPT